MKLKIKRLDPSLPLPEYKTAGAVGLDLYAAEDVIIGTGNKASTCTVGTGIAIELPEGYEAQIRPRSSTSAAGILVHLGTIDNDYRGELRAIVSSLVGDGVYIRRGDRIAQLIIAPVTRAEIVEAKELIPTRRGGNGFGSTN